MANAAVSPAELVERAGGGSASSRTMAVAWVQAALASDPARAIVRAIEMRRMLSERAELMKEPLLGAAIIAYLDSTPYLRIATSNTPRLVAPEPGVLLAATPRSGNTVLRRLMTRFGFSEYAAHSVDDVIVENLPPRCVLQVHTLPEPRTLEFLRSSGFPAATMARHPLDVLLSIRAFAQREPAVYYWLEGAGRIEAEDFGDDDSFLAWACGEGAAALLSVTPAWWHRPGVGHIRYEDMVDDPDRSIRSLMDQLGHAWTAEPDLLEAIEYERDVLFAAGHNWRAKAGAWEEIEPEQADLLSRKHGRVMVELGYSLPGGA